MKTGRKTTARDAKKTMARLLGGRNIQRMAWKTLARMYRAAESGSAVRQAINAECRRLGYTPRIVLGLAAE